MEARHRARAWWLAIRTLARVSGSLSSAMLGLVLVAGVAPVVLALAAGQLVNVIERDAKGSGGWLPPSTLSWVLVVTGAFLVQQLASATLVQVADALGRRLTVRLRSEVMTASLGPDGLRHMDDADVLDKLSVALGVGTARVTPREAMLGAANVTVLRFQGVCSAALLFAFRWWLAAAFLAAYAGLTHLFTTDYRRSYGGIAVRPGRLRRVEYLRDVGIRPLEAKDVRIFGLQRFLASRFDIEWSQAQAELAAQQPARRGTGLVLGIGILVSQLVVYVTIGLAAERGSISLGALVVFAGAVTGVIAVMVASPDVVYVRAGVAAVPAVAELHERISAAEFRLPGEQPVEDRPRRSIRFEGVGFAYPGGRRVFEHLDLEIRAGCSLGVVGLNGAGKTTLVKLLCRLYDPDSGRILVDGEPLTAFNAVQWQRRVAAVFQDFARYELSFAENVEFGAIEHVGDVGSRELALARAGAAELLTSMPDGARTVLSGQYPGGQDLSGGQWQRVALARALFAVQHGAGILVLDEPAAALDVRAEAALYDEFFTLTRGVTSVVISHRFATVRQADRIVVLENGRVAESGSHADLLAQNGKYARMFRRQAARFDEEPTTGEMPS